MAKDGSRKVTEVSAKEYVDSMRTWYQECGYIALMSLQDHLVHELEKVAPRSCMRDECSNPSLCAMQIWPLAHQPVYWVLAKLCGIGR